MNIVATYGMGGFDRSSPAALARDRELRYAKLFHVVSSYLQQGLSVWVDGNFPTTEWRGQLWARAQDHGVREVVVLQCICSDPSLLYERFARRRNDPSLPDAAANDVDAYFGSVQQFVPVGDQEISGFLAAEVLFFDSCRGILHPAEPSTSLGENVRHALIAENIIGSSATPSRPSSTD